MRRINFPVQYAVSKACEVSRRMYPYRALSDGSTSSIAPRQKSESCLLSGSSPLSGPSAPYFEGDTSCARILQRLACQDSYSVSATGIRRKAGALHFGVVAIRRWRIDEMTIPRQRKASVEAQHGQLIQFAAPIRPYVLPCEVRFTHGSTSIA